MSRFFLVGASWILSAAAATAQSLNLDLDVSAGSGGPGPAHTEYASAAASDGYWNEIGSLPSSALRSIHGAPTTVTVASSVHPLSLSFYRPGHSGTTSWDETILDDVLFCESDMLHLGFTGLEPGNYDVVTILVRTQGYPALRVEVAGSPDAAQDVATIWNGAYVQGMNYAVHRKTVVDGTIDLTVRLTVPWNNWVELAAVQLVKDGERLAGDPICFGDGIASTCPCSNDGNPGRGCENSAATRGAFLAATGVPDLDTVTLHGSGLLPSALSIFLQGNASITPVPYGDGLRCAGGTLRRLYTKSASGGYVLAPEPGDPSIRARSAALGVPIPADGRRYYQVYYRDPSTGYCAAPAGNTFNVTNAVRVDW